MFKFINKIYKSSAVRSVLMVSVVIGALITIGGFLYNSWSFYYENIDVSRNVSEKIADISSGQSINYFKQILGNEITSRSLSESMKEFIFKYKTSYIQAVTNNSDTVVFFSVTDCTNPITIQKSSFISTYSSDSKIFPNKVKLNRTTFSNFFGQLDTNKEFFYSGATANSYYYESVYLGNPANYQTIFAGVNDLCRNQFDTCMLSNKCSPQDILEYRKKVSITTYGESAPGEGDEIIKLLKDEHSGFYLGPDRIQFRVF